MKPCINIIIYAVISFFTAHIAVAQDASKSLLNADQIQEAIKSQLQLPAPPKGFVWKIYKNAAFLKPVQWKEREMEITTGTPHTLYATSPEDFSVTKQFEMGLTLRVFTGSQRIQNIQARDMAILYLDLVLRPRKKEEVLVLERNTDGDFERISVRYRDAPHGLKPIIVHQFILASNITDSVHIFIFESPVENWQENWMKYGTVSLNKITLFKNVPANHSQVP
jgi:hypothetical protein